MWNTSFDGGNFTIATSPLALSGLSQGNHTFAIRAVDNAGNIGPSANYTWTIASGDTSKPSLVSIVRQSPASLNTNAGNVTYQVTFNETVTGFDASDVSLALTGNLTTGSVQVSPVNETTYNVTVNGIVGNGTLGIILLNDGTIQDLAGNSLTSTSEINALSFTPATTYTASSQPSQVVVADLNGDGILDIATAGYGSQLGSVLLGNGNGSFQPRKTFLTSAMGSRAIGYGDFNGDGKVDLVTTLQNTSRINLFLGNGNGGFTLQPNVSTPLAPVDLQVGDFNNDGKLDVALVHRNNNWMSVFLGNGNGTFQTSKTYATGTTPNSVTAADLDGDGNLDLVVANSGNSRVSVFIGFGNGTFQNQQTLAVGSGPWGVSLADLNGDGKIDIAVANHSSDNIGVLLGNGNGTFQPQVTFATLDSPYYVEAGDMNGDGKLDLVIQSQGTGNLSILTGDGTGAFVQARSYAAGKNGGASGLALSDLDGDGRLDMVYMDFPMTGQGLAGVLLANNSLASRELYDRSGGPNGYVHLTTADGYFQAHRELPI